MASVAEPHLPSSTGRLPEIGSQGVVSDILRGISLVGEVTPRAKDKIISIGEKLSSVLFSYTMRLKTLPGIPIDSEEVVVTDETFCEAEPQMKETTAAAERSDVPVRR